MVAPSRLVLAIAAAILIALGSLAGSARGQGSDAGGEASGAGARGAVDAGAGPALDPGAGPAIDAGAVLAIDAGAVPAIDAGAVLAIDAGAAAVTDAGPISAIGAGDAGTGDAGTGDAGTGDAGASDAGTAAPPTGDAGVLDGGTGDPDARPPTAGHGGDRAGVVIRLVLGLTLLLVMAYLGGHRKVIALQERLGIAGLIAGGFPFLVLGVIVAQPQVGILTDDVLARMQPILHFGLGWLGFIIGAQLDIRLLDRVPKGTAYLIVVEAVGPFAATAAACAALALVLGVADWRAGEFWRDAIVLGAAGAMTAPRRFRGFANRGWREGRGVDHLVSQLDEIVGVIGLLFVAAYFRPAGGAAWQIPGTAWLFVSIGLGVAVGVLIFAMIRVPTNEGEFTAVVIGSVALGAGLAGYLFLSPIVVCFIAGALVVNFPCEQRDQIFRILNHLERPIHLLFLIVAGASWQVLAPAPWLIVPAFAVARVLGKWIGAATAMSTVGNLLPAGFASSRVLVSPLSPLAIALVVSLQGAAGGVASPWLVTVVVGGAILTELAVQLTSPPSPRNGSGGGTPQPLTSLAADADASGPIDELDRPDAAPAGPVYRDDLDDDEPGGHR